MKKVNYFGSYAIFTIKTGKFVNSYKSKKQAENELKKLNSNGVKYEIYHPEKISVYNL